MSSLRSDETKKPIQTPSKLPKDVIESTDHLENQTAQHHTQHPPSKQNTPQPKSVHDTPPNSADVNLSTHLSAHLTKKEPPQTTTPSKKPSHLGLDPDDLPLSRLVRTSTPGPNTPDNKSPLDSKTSGMKTPVTSPSDNLSDHVTTTLPADSLGKVSKNYCVMVYSA